MAALIAAGLVRKIGNRANISDSIIMSSYQPLKVICCTWLCILSIFVLSWQVIKWNDESIVRLCFLWCLELSVAKTECYTVIKQTREKHLLDASEFLPQFVTWIVLQLCVMRLWSFYYKWTHEIIIYHLLGNKMVSSFCYHMSLLHIAKCTFSGFFSKPTIPLRFWWARQ